MNDPKQNHIYCSQCGRENWSYSKFCQACGQPISAPPSRPSQKKVEEASKVAKKGIQKSKWFFIAPGFVIFGVVLFLLFRFVVPSANPNSLIGKWDYVSTNAGYDAFQENIEFYSDGTCYIPSPFLSTRNFQYSFPKSGKIRLTANNFSVEYGYTVNRDNLRIYFEDGGYNDYVRSGAALRGNPAQGSTYAVITRDNLEQLKPISIYLPGFLGIGKQKRPIPIVGTVTWSPDSKKIFIPYTTGMVDFSSSELIVQGFMKNLKRPPDIILPDGTRPIDDYEIHDQNGQTLLAFSGKPTFISPDSKFFVTYDETEKRTIIWNLETYQEAFDFQNTQSLTTNFLGISNNGMIAVIAIMQRGSNGNPDKFWIELWDTKSWKVTKQTSYEIILGSGKSCGTTYPQHRISAAQFTRDDKRIAVWLVNICEEMSQIFITDIASGTHLQTLSIEASWLFNKKIDFSADGKLLFAYSDQKVQINVYDITNNDWLTPLDIKTERGSWPFMGLSPDGRFLICDAKLFAVQK